MRSQMTKKVLPPVPSLSSRRDFWYYTALELLASFLSLCSGGPLTRGTCHSEGFAALVSWLFLLNGG